MPSRIASSLGEFTPHPPKRLGLLTVARCFCAMTVNGWEMLMRVLLPAHDSPVNTSGFNLGRSNFVGCFPLQGVALAAGGIAGRLASRDHELACKVPGGSSQMQSNDQ